MTREKSATITRFFIGGLLWAKAPTALVGEFSFNGKQVELAHTLEGNT